MTTPYETRPRPDSLGELDWMDSAACAEVGTEWFFPEQGGDSAPARAVCASCDVIAECLGYALRTGQTDGVWGGKTPLQRRYLRRRNNHANGGL